MKNINKILALKEKIESNNIVIPIIPTKDILLESLAYDGEFNKTQILQLSERVNFISKKYGKQSPLLHQIDIKDMLDNIKIKINQDNVNLNCLFMIEYINEYWSEIFGTGSKKVSLQLEEGIFTTTALIKSICRFLFKLLNQKPLLRYNYSRGLYITNYLLNSIGLPGILFSYKDRKRILRSIDYFIDFEKEFGLTLEGELHKLFYESLYPDSIVDINTLREIKQVKNAYISPGTWWYGSDRKKYTFNIQK